MPRSRRPLTVLLQSRGLVRHARRIDGVLATSIRRLRSGEDEEEVLATLRLHLEGRLRGEAGRHYLHAVERLRDATGRDWVFDNDRRERSWRRLRWRFGESRD